MLLAIIFLKIAEDRRTQLNVLLAVSRSSNFTARFSVLISQSWLDFVISDSVASRSNVMAYYCRLHLYTAPHVLPYVNFYCQYFG